MVVVKMKTRNTSTVTVKENKKIKNVSKSKKTKIIKPKETVKDASYRDLHNIGRRKSTSSVVTYSLDSRLFFDVYAKFNNENLPKDRNIYNSMYTNNKKSQAVVPTKRRLPSQDIHSSYSEIDSSNELETPKNMSKIAKASYEAKPIRHDEACIPSPKIPATSPIRPRSTDHRVISSRNLRPASSNVAATTNEIKDTKSITTGSKSQTFQRLLDNKTVFKKHLSQKQQKSISSITPDRRLSTRLNKSLISSPESTEHERELNGKKKLERQSEPRGKRIASLNAAAIINCVQNLFDDSTGQGDNKRRSVRRRVSKSAVGTLSITSTEKPNKIEVENLENRENSYSNPLALVIETNNESEKNRHGSQASSRADEVYVHSDKSGSLKSAKQINNMQVSRTKFPVVQSVTKKPIVVNGPNQSMIVVKSPKKKNSIPQFFDITATVSNGKQKDRIYHLKDKRSKVLSGSTILPISINPVITATTSNKKNIIKEESIITTTKEILIDSSKGHGAFPHSTKKKKKQPLPSKVIEPPDLGDQNGESLWQWEGEPFQKLIQIQLAGSLVERTCYNSIRHSRDDIVIRIMDCVMLRSNTEDQEPFLAKVTMFYLDDETGKKMMSMLWYYRPEHTEQGRLPWHTDSDVYASRHLDNNSIDCIEDKAFVLPVELYSRFMAYQKRQSAGSRPSLAARLIPVNGDDSIISDSEENKPTTVLGDSCADMFISSFYYTINFQNSFPAEMTSSNVFVCRGLYDINQHKITRNILQAIQSPKLDSVEACESVDSAMSISSCDTEPKHEVSTSQTVLKTPLSKIPIPPATSVGHVTNNCLPPISSFQNCVSNKSQEETTTTVSTVITTRIAATTTTTTTTTVPATKSCPLPPPSKPVQPPLPLSSIAANDIVVATFLKQPNGHA